MSVLSACGGSTSKLQQGQRTCHIPDPRNGHQGYGQQLYDVGFWQPAEMVVGLASKDGSSPVDADIVQVANEINGILARWATDRSSGKPLTGTTSDTSDFQLILPQQEVVVAGVEELGFNHAPIAAAIFRLQRPDRDLSGSPADQATLKAAIDCVNASDPVVGAKLIENTNTVITGASPDWSMNGVPGGGFGGGHPDGVPQPLSSFQANSPVAGDGAGQGKVVYVLDTAPVPAGATQHGDADAAVPLGQGYCTLQPTSPSGCRLLDDLIARQNVDLTDHKLPDETAYICAYSPQQPRPCAANAGTQQQDLKDIRGHGLFASAIIHHLAPLATIHLVRVLDDYGVGDLRTLLEALSRIATSSATDPRNALVNLSLSIEPPPACLVQIWRSGYEGYINPQHHLRLDQCKQGTLVGTSDPQAYRNRLFIPLGQVIRYMVTKMYTIAAAAGNESADGQHYGADMPAAFCGVNAVAALAAGKDPGDWGYADAIATSLAPFSNAPLVAPDQCLDVLPPTTQSPSQSASIRPVGATGESNGLVAPGVDVCSLYLPPSGAQASTDAATWGGTSFATAFVTGNLAGSQNTDRTSWRQSQPCTPTP
jgi:Subtilase family